MTRLHLPGNPRGADRIMLLLSLYSGRLLAAIAFVAIAAICYGAQLIRAISAPQQAPARKAYERSKALASG